MGISWTKPEGLQRDLLDGLGVPPAGNDIEAAIGSAAGPVRRLLTTSYSGEAPPVGESRGCKATRDRVTVDLRGLGSRLRSKAAQCRITPAALVRKAVVQLLDDGSDDCCSPHGASAVDRPAVKVTLRLTPKHAVALAARARASDVAQGVYVCRLLDGAPPAPLPPDHASTVAVLMTSTDRLAAISTDLNAFLRLLGQVPSERLEGYRAGLVSLATDVRAHLASAAALIAELRPSRRSRR